MEDIRKIIKGLRYCSTECSPECPYTGLRKCSEQLCKDVLDYIEKPEERTRGRIKYCQSWQSLGEAFVLELTTDGTTWKEVHTFFVRDNRVDWKMIKMLHDWDRMRIPYTFKDNDRRRGRK